jgi:hypothetical protein
MSLHSNSRTNRDRRDQAFARAVIAAAERRRRDDEAREALPESEQCLYCGTALDVTTYHPYCTVQCAVDAGNE